MPDEESGSSPTGNANHDSTPVHQSPVSDDIASDIEQKSMKPRNFLRMYIGSLTLRSGARLRWE